MVKCIFYMMDINLPLITEKLKQDPDFLEDDITFQQDGAPARYENFWIITLAVVGLVEGGL